MLLEISTTAPHARDLGFMLHKNPANVYERSLPYGQTKVFYTEAGDERCTAVLLLELDPVALVRRNGDQGFALSQYVNDRPYVASSFLSVAIGQAFSSALAGRSKERPERVAEAWPLRMEMPAVDCDAGADFIRGLFEPLGYTVDAEPIPLDETFREWGASTLFRLILTATLPISNALSHLYVLLPVLDNQKHYGVGADEVTKLLDNAGPWLSAHPLRDVITRRYLRYRRSLVQDALDRLAENAVDEEPVATDPSAAQLAEDALEQPIRLHDIRLDVVAETLRSLPGARTVIDLGCGEGKLIQRLKADGQWTRIVGMDVAARTLAVASRRLHLDKGRIDPRIALIQGSLLYRDDRLSGFDAAALVEVVEHIEPDRLEFVERVVFGYARPRRIVATTPNADYNPHWPSLPAGKFRHYDHRFEWDRERFAAWTAEVGRVFGYTVEVTGIGEEDGALGAPTQMAVFDRD